MIIPILDPDSIHNSHLGLDPRSTQTIQRWNGTHPMMIITKYGM